MAERGEGDAIRFIREHQDYQRDWCVIWPFSTTRGYGRFGYLGKGYYAHRFMCELAHGAPPSDIHEAAHSCGDSTCVNPRHLSWKTPGENGLDCRQHGTHVRSRYGTAGKITAEQAIAIRDQKDVKKLRELADEYGVSESCISNIWVGKTHYRPSKVRNWTDEEDGRLRESIARGLNFTQIAKLFPDRQPKGVVGRAYRIGLKSGQPLPPSERGSQ
jgi:hypothetical protein